MWDWGVEIGCAFTRWGRDLVTLERVAPDQLLVDLSIFLRKPVASVCQVS